jgi:hypothetical protein
LVEATQAVADVLPAEPPALGPADTVRTLARDEECGPKLSITVRPTVSSGDAGPSLDHPAGGERPLARHLEDLRRENERLWAHVHEERTARIHEIELLNGLIASVRRA